MKQFKYEEWLFVEVPDDAITFNIEEDFDYLDYEQVMNGVGLYRRNAINKSSIPVKEIRQYSIIGKADELTEYEWGNIFELILPEAQPSGFQLIKSKGMQPQTTLVLKLNEAHTGDKV